MSRHCVQWAKKRKAAPPSAKQKKARAAFKQAATHCRALVRSGLVKKRASCIGRYLRGEMRGGVFLGPAPRKSKKRR